MSPDQPDLDEKCQLHETFTRKFVPPAPSGMSVRTPEQKSEQLTPGRVSSGLLPNGQLVHVIGRVPYDGSTRQQRRAVARLSKAS
jgi:hypothetical protein